MQQSTVASGAADFQALENSLRAAQSEQELRRAYAEARAPRGAVSATAWKRRAAGVGAERPPSGTDGARHFAQRRQVASPTSAVARVRDRWLESGLGRNRARAPDRASVRGLDRACSGGTLRSRDGECVCMKIRCTLVTKPLAHSWVIRGDLPLSWPILGGECPCCASAASNSLRNCHCKASRITAF